MTQPTLINLYHNEYSQELRYYPFTINLDKCAGSCNTLDDFLVKLENVTWIKIEIMISIGVSVKIQKNRAKKVIFGILQNVAAKIVNMKEVLVIQ